MRTSLFSAWLSRPDGPGDLGSGPTSWNGRDVGTASPAERKSPRAQAPPEETATVAVIIPTFRRPATLQILLNSLAVSDLRPDEVIVVDNDPEASACVGDEQNYPVRLLNPGLGLSLAGARNFGWRQSTADVCVFVDDDIAFAPGALRCLVLASQEERVGLVGPVIFDGYTQRVLCAGISRSKWTGHTRLLHRESSTLPDSPRWPTADMPAVFGVRRTVLSAVGGLDEDNFPIHYDEADLGVRIRDLGMQLIVLRDARVTHVGGYTSEHLGDTMTRYTALHGPRRVELTVRSRVRFHRYHSHGLARISTLAVFIPLWTIGIIISCARANTDWRTKSQTMAAVLRGLVEGYGGWVRRSASGKA